MLSSAISPAAGASALEKKHGSDAAATPATTAAATWCLSEVSKPTETTVAAAESAAKEAAEEVAPAAAMGDTCALLVA
jgi:hypothetical protein